MREARFLLAILVALAAASCARQQQVYVLDPVTGQSMPAAMQQSYAAPQYSQQSYAQPQDAQPSYRQPVAPPQEAASTGRGLSWSQMFARPQYAQPSDEQSQYAAQPYQQSAPNSERGLFTARSSAQQTYPQQPVPQTDGQPYVQPPVQQPYILQYTDPQYAAAPSAPPQYVTPQYAPPSYGAGGPYVATPYGHDYASASPYQQPYTLDAGDKLRVVVFGQDGISNSYIVDAGGNVNLPLVGVVAARGATTQQLARMLAERLKQGYVREPHVSVEIETYRPFFILGEVTNPGQYPYVADMKVEQAIAIAGGFAPRAYKRSVELTRSAPGEPIKGEVPLTYPVRPGDTVVVKERWF
jgi:polysaccharide export outer membrane protein